MATEFSEEAIQDVKEALEISDPEGSPDTSGRPPEKLEERDLCQRIRDWFVEAMDHDLWKKYIPEADIDEGYYVGGDDQWVDGEGGHSDAERLRDQNRAVVSLNHIQPIIGVLTGFERQNQSDIKASPQGGEDANQTMLLSMVLKFVQDQCDASAYQSQSFETGTIRGLGCLEVGINWDEEPVHGQIQLRHLVPGRNIIWDPYWGDMGGDWELVEARYVLKFRWVHRDDLKAEYRDKASIIEAATVSLDSAFQASGKSTDGAAADGYGAVNGHPIEDVDTELKFYRPDDDRLLVIEAWYRTWDRVKIAVNEETGKIETSESEDFIKQLVAADPTRWRVRDKRVRRIRMATVIPAAWLVLESLDTPYENDREHYPYVPFIANRRRNTVYGVVRNLRDPQMIENKRVSQILDILIRFANLRPLVPEGSLVNAQDLDDYHAIGPIRYNKSKGEPGWFHPPLSELANVLTQMGMQAKVNIREISGINTDLLGIKGDTSSGIAIARRQAQGQIIATPLFDNLKRARKVLGHRLARRIQQVFTAEQTLRLLNPETGEQVVVKINPRVAKNMSDDEYKSWQAGQILETGEKPLILRSVESLKYDVVITEAPATPTQRQAALLALMEVVGKVPQVLPALIDTILELADIPDRYKIINRVRALMPPPLQQADAPDGGGPPVAGPPGQGPPIGPGQPAGPAATGQPSVAGVERSPALPVDPRVAAAPPQPGGSDRYGPLGGQPPQ